MITRPTILFLDEPTSGLDSHSSMVLIESLRKIAKEQKTIICCTIHQPSSKLFEAFDRVMCMRKGKILFQGLNGQAASRAWRIERQLLAEAVKVDQDFKKFVDQYGFINDKNCINDENCNCEFCTSFPSMNNWITYNTITGFLKGIDKPMPRNESNLCEWLIYLAQNMTEDEVKEVLSKQKEIYKDNNRGCYKDDNRAGRGMNKNDNRGMNNNNNNNYGFTKGKDIAKKKCAESFKKELEKISASKKWYFFFHYYLVFSLLFGIKKKKKKKHCVKLQFLQNMQLNCRSLS